ncbi:MAG: rhodanese-like domain-containing protein, partial [Bacteroidota bacterium]
LSRLDLNKKLGITVGALGLIALVAGNPYQGHRTTINAKELSLIVSREVDHVTVHELADWIIQGRADYRLVDLRSETEFLEYHIPTAEHSPVASLTEAPLLRNETIVLYSDGGIHSAQAWMLLKARGFRGVYMLQGGLEEWKESILFPTLVHNAGPEERSAFEKVKEISAYFGGTPMQAVPESASRPSPIPGGPVPQLALPTPELSAPGLVPGGTPRKKKKEGC